MDDREIYKNENDRGCVVVTRYYNPFRPTFRTCWMGNNNKIYPLLAFDTESEIQAIAMAIEFIAIVEKLDI